MLHNENKAPTRNFQEGTAVQSPWKNLQGPARLLAMCATILLVASALGGLEAGIMILLGPARNIVIKPFILLGYLEICAMFFSLLGIVVAVLGWILSPLYRFASMQLLVFRAKRAGEVSDEFTTFEEVAHASPTHNPEEDGSPD
jgi:hypothetical protein